ncbi:MAG TPA: DUF488 domain-containing protein [Dehalococcoidia bacterium]|nr:DUF488 domain-containing protein [Dehalococcoidia bacterium]
MSTELWTVGHSNQPAAALVETLVEASIELLVDVRRYPMSRRNPQFNRDALAVTLSKDRIEYRLAEALGGRREPRPDSVNTALRNEGFRGYADYMATLEFEEALGKLIETAGGRRTAIMCAESLPWNCHRSLIADALTARGIEVEHLMSGKTQTHRLTPTARIDDLRVSYPALL